MAVVINVVLSTLVSRVAAWLSGRLPRAPGFVVALPLPTVLVWPDGAPPTSGRGDEGEHRHRFRP
jgi:hypothetical protein